MAVMKRNGHFFIYLRPFKTKKIGIKLDVATKTEAKQAETLLLRACRSGDYGALDPVARETCIRMFTNQGWELPPELQDRQTPREELTLWKAAELFLRYPEIRKARSRYRYELCLVHLVEHFGKDQAVKAIWAPEIKQYMIERLNSGVSPSTVNWEKATLSKMFQVLVELRQVDTNPVRLVKNLSQKSEERQAYVSLRDVTRIVERCPEWFRPFAWTAYYTGMRRGEILGLTRKQVDLSKRMLFLRPQDTKEGHWKRVPVHRELVPILGQALKVAALGSDSVFIVKDGRAVRPVNLESVKNPWPRACQALDLEKPWPRFHDLRHTWRTNARRSGVDPQIAESILGHYFKGKTVNERYGRISNRELIEAVDKMTFDHGETEIIVAGH